MRLNTLTNRTLRRLPPASFNAVCRRLRHETSGMYWTNAFTGSCTDPTFSLRHMRSQAHLVRSIEIIPNGYVLSFDP